MVLHILLTNTPIDANTQLKHRYHVYKLIHQRLLNLIHYHSILNVAKTYPHSGLYHQIQTCVSSCRE